MTIDGWEGVKRRYEAWWNADLHDRPLLQVTAPRDGAPDAVPWKDGRASAEEKWTDIGYALWVTEQQLRRTWYGGEALPAVASYQSPIGMSAGGALLFGCAPRFSEDTVWVDSLPAAAGLPDLRVDPGRRRWIRDCFEAAGRASRGRFYVRESFCNGSGDTLAAIRGTEQLLIDLVERPAWVAEAVTAVSDTLRGFVRELLPLVSPEVTGMEGWLSSAGMWSPGVNFCADCDVSCMVSPRCFEETFLPPLRDTMREYQHNLYHLDGGEAVRHLDVLLACPEIDGIQWIPGAGREAVMPWVPLLRRIQDAGKCVQVLARPEEVSPLLAAISPKGLLISTTCASEAEGRDLLRVVQRASGIGPRAR
jgi:hypothetical protein